MALSKRKQEQQEAWVATTDLPKSPGHLFNRKLNQLLAEAGFDAWLEALCRPYYAQQKGRPSIPPGTGEHQKRGGRQRLSHGRDAGPGERPARRADLHPRTQTEDTLEVARATRGTTSGGDWQRAKSARSAWQTAATIEK